MNASKGSGAMGGGGGRGKEEGPYEMKDSLVWDGFEKDGVLTASLAENFQSLLLKVYCILFFICTIRSYVCHYILK